MSQEDLKNVSHWSGSVDEEMYQEMMDILSSRSDELGDLNTEDMDVLIIARPRDQTQFKMYYECENIALMIGMLEIFKNDLLNELDN